MAMQIIPRRHPQTKQPLIIIQAAPEAADAVGLMRNLKRSFPKEWRQVNYEIIQAAPEESEIVNEEGEVGDAKPATSPIIVGD